MNLSFLFLFLIVGCVGSIGPEERIKSFYKDLSSSDQLNSLESHFSSKESMEYF